MKNLKIGIQNSDFAISLIIQQVKFQIVWFREMMKNALEATEKYAKDNPNLAVPQKIRVRAKKLVGLFRDYTAPKLSVLNFKGMTRFELGRAIQLFCEVDKVQDFLRNFGIGMKITLSRFSDVMIITHKDYATHYVVFGLDSNNNLVVLKNITDCTDWAYDSADDRGYDMNHDWTEVILLGKGNKKLVQNTLTHTFDADEGIAKIHVLKNMFTRFVDIPKSIDVVFEAGDSGNSTPHNGGVKSGNLIFKTKEDLWDRALKEFSNTTARKEVYQHSSGVKVHLIHDAPKDGKGSDPVSSYSENRQATDSQFVSLIWGDQGARERYDIIDAGRWRALASNLGIYNGYKYMKIDVELPFKDYEPTMDRSGLKKRNYRLTDENAEVFYKDYIEVIKEVIKSPEAEWFDKIRDGYNDDVKPVDRDDLIREWLAEFYSGMDLLKQEQKGKNKPGKEPGDLDITFNDEVLKCPKCRKKGIITDMPKGQKTCDVCGYTRKNRKNDKPKSEKDVLMDTPLPEFRDSNELGVHFASLTINSSAKDVLQTNPDHKAIEKLTALALNKKTKHGLLQELDQDGKNKLRLQAYKLLQAQAGVTTVIAQARAQFDEWFTPNDFDSITSETHYTFESYNSQHLVEHLKCKGSDLLRDQKQFLNINPNVLGVHIPEVDLDTKKLEEKLVLQGGKLPIKDKA